MSRSASGVSLRFRLARAFRRSLGLDRERRWNTQYAEGAWDSLRSLDELAHHAILAGYFARLKWGGTLLDVGCGEGIFQEQLRGCYSSYIGLDFAAPVQQAQSKANERTRFIVADMTDFITDQRFDAVVFNESVYYHHDPLACLLRYECFLAPGGVLLVSMHVNDRTASFWSLFAEHYTALDTVTVTNGRRVSWTVKVLVPPSDGVAPESPTPPAGPA